MPETWSATRYLANPYSYYARLRATDPVHWNSALQLWTLTRHADVVSALTHPALSSQRPRPKLDDPAVRSVHDSLAAWLLRSDPPVHTRLRALATRGLHTHIVRLHTRICAHAEQLIDVTQPRRGMEVISELAAPLAFEAIAALIGLPPQDHVRFRRWADEVGAAVESRPQARLMTRAQRSLAEASSYIEDVIEHRRKEPANDLLTEWISAPPSEDRLSDNEIAVICTLLLLAGHETATHLLANGVLALLRHPDQFERLRAEPALSDSAVHELLRYDSPLQGLLRLAVEDLEVSGRRIVRGQSVLVWLAAANRDPEQFVAPDRLDIGRKANRHIAFGHGIHHCLGASLGLMIASAGIERLLSRAEKLRLASDRTEWQGNCLFALHRCANQSNLVDRSLQSKAPSRKAPLPMAAASSRSRGQRRVGNDTGIYRRYPRWTARNRHRRRWKIARCGLDSVQPRKDTNSRP